MSAVAAFLRLSDRAPSLERAELRRALDAVALRGDTHGEWWHRQRHVALGARTGALGADQPLVAPATGSVLVLDGRLLDRAALAASYEARGLGAPDGASSAQLLLDLLELRGERALHDLRGAFALAYWDERRRALLLARDGFGARPLYYAATDGVLRAASTVRALEATGAVPLDRDPAAEAGFLLTGSVPEPFTWHRAVRALPAGHFLWVGAGDGVVHEPRAWVRLERELVRSIDVDGDANVDAAPGPIAASCDLAAAATEAVQAHLAPDVDAPGDTLGCLVSGSVASRSLLALVAQHGDVRAVHLDAPDRSRPTGSEAARLVQEVASHSGADVLRASLCEDRFNAEWKRLAEQMDQPSLGGLVTYFACKAAREAGIERVVLGHAASLVLDDAWARSVSTPFAVGAGVFERDELVGVMGVERAREGLSALDAHAADERAQRPDTGGDVGLERVVDALVRLRGGRLRDVDWAASAHGVRVELPFCDLNLWRRVGALVVERARSCEPSALLAPGSLATDDARDVLGHWAAGAHRSDRRDGFDGRDGLDPRTSADAAGAWTRVLARHFVDQEAA